MVPCSPDPPRYDCSMTFIEDTRTRLLGTKRVFGNIRNSVVAISDAIAYNSADGLSRLSVVSIFSLTPADALLARVGIRKRFPLPIKPNLPDKACRAGDSPSRP
jgi:hypothetical protein